MSDDDLSDFEQTEFTHDGKTSVGVPEGHRTGGHRDRRDARASRRRCWPSRARSPASAAPRCSRTCSGCRAAIPTSADRLRSRRWPSAMVPACVSKEFVVLATGRTSPVIDWLRALARAEHARCGGPGVGAVGMCFTGGYALAMATDDVLLAPVLAQPSMPVGLTRGAAAVDRHLARGSGDRQGALRPRADRARIALRLRQIRRRRSGSTSCASNSATPSSRWN